MKNEICFPLCFIAASQLQGSPERPNIVFIMADDLGWKDTGIYGSTYYQTPNIDRLANQGMRFTEAYSASPLCSPTRASIMTGQFPAARIGITGAFGHVEEIRFKPTISTTASSLMKAVTPESATRLDLSYYTIAEALRDAGYQTAHFGKWHLGTEEYVAKHQGFNVTVGGDGHPGPRSYFSPYRMDSIPDGPEGEQIDRRMAAEAIRFMKEHKNQPFYINLWFYDVHAPYQAEKELIQKYEKLRDPANPQNNPVMAAMIETMDDCVGQIMKALSELGLDDNTLLIFTSDNGGQVKPDTRFSNNPPTSNLPLREGKGSTYEGGTRVPLIMRWPGVITPNTISKALISSVDYYPTFLKLGGATGNENQVMDGINLLPVITGEQPLPERDIFCLFQHYLDYVNGKFRIEPGAYVRRGNYKLIRFFARGENGSDELELYNLKEDIGETRNLADAMPELATELNNKVGEYLKDTGAVVPFANPKYQPYIKLKKVGITFITYAQEKEPHIFIYNKNSALRQPEGSVKLSLRVPASGTVSWSTVDAPTIKKGDSVRFTAEDFDKNGEAVIRIKSGGTDIKDIRIELDNPESIPFKSVALFNSQGKELFSVDLTE